VRRAVVVSAVAVVVAVSAGCWPDWARLFDTTPSTEHRIEDLRVLAIEVQPDASFHDDTFAMLASAVVVDPRGGKATVEFSVCRRESEFAPCLDADIVDSGVAEFPGDGLFGVSRPFADVAPALRALSIDDEDFVLDASPVFFDIIVNVATVGRDPVERERASITIAGYNPLRIADEAVDDFRTCRNPDDPEQNPVCAGDAPAFPVCGNEVVEIGETCDPPDGALCDERCGADGECPSIDAACLVGTDPNVVPVISAVRVDDEIEDDAVVPTDGGADVGQIVVDRGSVVTVQPVVAHGAFDTFQPWFSKQGFAPDVDCGSGLVAGCPQEELPQVRFYVYDGPLDIAVESAPGEVVDVNARGITIADIVVPTDAPTGVEAVWMVVSDGRGGMAARQLLLEVR
jgi:hypothetical protein